MKLLVKHKKNGLSFIQHLKNRPICLSDAPLSVTISELQSERTMKICLSERHMLTANNTWTTAKERHTTSV